MGQQESKQKLEQIIQSLNKIRKDVRNGKITANDVERIQAILQTYSRELGESKNLKTNSVYTVEQLIEITSKELDALKQEVNTELVGTSTNSFSRGSSKRQTNEKRKSIKSITDAVHDIRHQIRSGDIQKENFDSLQRDLANYSQLLSSKKSKKTEADAAQKLISSVTQELLIKQQENINADPVRRSTITRRAEHLPTNKSEKRSSLKGDIRKETPKINNKNNISTLDDIETKFDTLKNDIKVAETNKDKSRLHFLAKLIQTLMTDLQMITASNETVVEEKKDLLEKKLKKAYQKIDNIKRQLTEENDLKYLTELHEKERNEQYLSDLDDISKALVTIGKNVNVRNFQAEKETLNQYKNKLNTIEEINQEVSLKKSEVANLMLNVENVFTRIEMEERLNQAEYRHFQYKIDLATFADTYESETYRKHRQYLLQLKDYVSKVIDIDNKIEEKKKYVLYNIDNNIVALDQKANENKDVPKNVQDEVVLRKVASNTNSFNNVLTTLKTLPAQCTPDELMEILSALNQTKSIVEQKLNFLQATQQQGESEIQLVTVREKKIEPVTNAAPSALSQAESIQKEVESLQITIENSQYTKDTYLYKDIKSKLESFKKQISNLAREGEEGKFSENIHKYIDNVILLLENNASTRKSTTEDILIDIMSVSTRVNDLGNKIKASRYTIQDYDVIQNNLLEHKNYLKQIQISPNRTNLLKSRDEVLQQIENYLSNLTAIKKNNSGWLPEEEKTFNQDLRKLKDKVQRYSGTYKNVLYKTIENDLDKYSVKADKVFKDSNVALKVKQDIENIRMILEQKSIKDQQYNDIKSDVKDSNNKELAEIKQNIETVRKALNRTDLLNKEDLDKMDATLTLSILTLDSIRDDHLSEEKKKLYYEIHDYFKKIRELLLMNVTQSMPVEKFHQKAFDEKQTAATIIARIEHELKEIEPEIMKFVGTETSPSFLHLDEIIVRDTLKLDEMNLDQTSELYKLKAKLIRDLNKYSDILDDRVNQTEAIENLEKEVRVMLMKIDSFNGYFGDSEYMYLDEEIIKLKVNLGKIQVNQQLATRKENCIKEVDICMKKLNEAAKSRTSAITGTLV